MSRTIKRFLSFLLILQLIIPYTTFAAAVGEFSSVVGSVTQTRAKQVMTPSVKSPVEIRDLVATAKSSSAMMVFSDNSTIRLSENTRMEIREFLFKEKSRRGVFSLAMGKLSADVKQYIGGDNVFEVRSPTVVVGVRGTGFEFIEALKEGAAADVTGKGVATVSCTEGSLNLSALSPVGEVVSAAVLEAGQMAVIVGGVITISAIGAVAAAAAIAKATEAGAAGTTATTAGTGAAAAGGGTTASAGAATTGTATAATAGTGAAATAGTAVAATGLSTATIAGIAIGGAAVVGGAAAAAGGGGGSGGGGSTSTIPTTATGTWQLLGKCSDRNSSAWNLPIYLTESTGGSFSGSASGKDADGTAMQIAMNGSYNNASKAFSFSLATTFSGSSCTREDAGSTTLTSNDTGYLPVMQVQSCGGCPAHIRMIKQ